MNWRSASFSVEDWPEAVGSCPSNDGPEGDDCVDGSPFDGPVGMGERKGELGADAISRLTTFSWILGDLYGHASPSGASEAMRLKSRSRDRFRAGASFRLFEPLVPPSSHAFAAHLRAGRAFASPLLANLELAHALLPYLELSGHRYLPRG